MRLKLFSILIALVSALTLSSQELEWSVDMNAVFNNREGGNEETPAQTFIFTRITPQIGVSMDSARHRIMGGVTWYQPMNDHLHGYKVLPSLYYHYKNKDSGLGFAFGVIPNAVKTPTFLKSDSLKYVSPNVKGFVIDVQKPHFLFLSWLDWRQLRTNNIREAFDVTAQAFWLTDFKGDNLVSAGGMVRYNHLANRYGYSEEDEHGVVDNVILSPQVNYCHNWRGYGNITITAAMLFSSDRDRSGDNKWLTQIGFYGSVGASWKWLTIKEDIYAGQRQMPLYEKYGSLLYQGDQFYHNKFYSRTDLVATIFQKEFVNLEARLTFHATDKTTAFWQQLALRFYIDRDQRRYKHNNAGSLLPSNF